jgi:hypothetical protein
MTRLPEQFGADMVTRLQAEAALDRFEIAFDAKGLAVEELLGETGASDLRGEVWVRHVPPSVREPLGLGADAVIDTFELLVIDPSFDVDEQQEATAAVERALADVRLDGAATGCDFLTGWGRVELPEADHVRATVAQLRVEHDDLRP